MNKFSLIKIKMIILQNVEIVATVKFVDLIQKKKSIHLIYRI